MHTKIMEKILRNPNSFLSLLISISKDVESTQPLQKGNPNIHNLIENYEHIFYGSTYLRTILGKFVGTVIQRLVCTKTEFRFILYDESQEQQELQESFDYFEGEEDQKLDIENYVTKISFLVPLSAEAITLALYYLDFVRFEVGLEVTKVNIHKLFVAAFLLASKFSYDKVYSNSYYSRVFGFSLAEVNTLEVNFIRLIKFNITPDYDAWNAYFNAVLSVVARNIPNPSLIFSPPNSSLLSATQQPPSPIQPSLSSSSLSSSTSTTSTSTTVQTTVGPMATSSQHLPPLPQKPLLSVPPPTSSTVTSTVTTTTTTTTITLPPPQETSLSLQSQNIPFKTVSEDPSIPPLSNANFNNSNNSTGNISGSNLTDLPKAGIPIVRRNSICNEPSSTAGNDPSSSGELINNIGGDFYSLPKTGHEQRQAGSGQGHAQRGREASSLAPGSTPGVRVRERRASESVIKLPFESINPKEDSRPVKTILWSKPRQPAPFPIILSNNNTTNNNNANNNPNINPNSIPNSNTFSNVLSNSSGSCGGGNSGSSMPARSGNVVISGSGRTRPGREKSSSFSSIVPIFTLSTAPQTKSPSSISPRNSDISSSAGSTSGVSRRPYPRIVIKTPQNVLITGSGSEHSPCSDSSLEGSLSELSPVKRMAFMNSPDRVFPSMLATPKATASTKLTNNRGMLSPRSIKTRSKSRENAVGAAGSSGHDSHRHHHHHHHHRNQQLAQYKRRNGHIRSCSNNDAKVFNSVAMNTNSGSSSSNNNSGNSSSEEKRLDVPPLLLKKMDEQGNRDEDSDESIGNDSDDEGMMDEDSEMSIDMDKEGDVNVDADVHNTTKKMRAFSFSNDACHSSMIVKPPSHDATISPVSVSPSEDQANSILPHQDQLLMPSQQACSVPVSSHPLEGLNSEMTSETILQGNNEKPTFKIVIEDNFDFDDDDDDDDDSDDSDEDMGIDDQEKGNMFYGSFNPSSK